MSSGEYDEEDWIDLSGIQHFAICKRQWALIHVERLWNDNYLTTAGSLEHKRVDDYSESETRGDLLIIRSLRVFSRLLGVTGVCDVVEFHADSHGVPIRGHDGLWIPYPVEYKHGKTKVNDADRLQLCAEAICLEEMLSCSIPEGALFYQQTRRREVIEVSERLRKMVLDDFTVMHDWMSRGHTPKAKLISACKSCSLRDRCLPELTKRKTAKAYIADCLKTCNNDNE